MTDTDPRGGPTVGLLGPSAAHRCRRRVHLDADPSADRSRRRALDDGTRHRIADAEAHQIAVRARAATAPGAVVGPLPPGGGPGGVVVAPELASPDRAGAPDLLIWSGDGWVPVLVRNHRTTDPGGPDSGGVTASPVDRPQERRLVTDRRPRVWAGDLLMLAHFHRVLSDLGLASSHAEGAVIGRGRHESGAAEPGRPVGDDADLLVWVDLEHTVVDYDVRFADRRAVAAAAAAGAAPLARPSRVGECRRCPWWPVCEEELTVARDVSLVAAGADVVLFRQAGLGTVDALAAAPAAQVEGLPLTGMDPATARIRARAWAAGWALVRRTERVWVPRADVELDVDMESYLDDGAYLWGTFLSGAGLGRLGRPAGYRPFVTWQPLPDRDEGRAFAEFWAHLSALRRDCAAAGLSFTAYCYSRSAEERWLASTPARYPGVPGMPARAEVAAFCAGSEWVDVFEQVRAQFLVIGSLKLKVLARLAGFTWRDPEPGGANSMAWYDRAVGRAEPAGPTDADVARPVDKGSARRILEYNEDDVRATLALRTWLNEHGSDFPTAAELAADPPDGPVGSPPAGEGQRGGMRSDPSSLMVSPLR